MGTVNCFYVFFLSFSFFKFCFLSRLFNGDSQVLQILDFFFFRQFCGDLCYCGSVTLQWFRCPLWLMLMYFSFFLNSA